MAATPRYKVFTARGEYVASFKHVDDAAAFVAIQGDGATVRLGHSKRLILWTEGREGRSAGDSSSAAAELMLYREDNPHEIPHRPARDSGPAPIVVNIDSRADHALIVSEVRRLIREGLA